MQPQISLKVRRRVWGTKQAITNLYKSMGVHLDIKLTWINMQFVWTIQKCQFSTCSFSVKTPYQTTKYPTISPTSCSTIWLKLQVTGQCTSHRHVSGGDGGEGGKQRRGQSVHSNPGLLSKKLKTLGLCTVLSLSPPPPPLTHSHPPELTHTYTWIDKQTNTKSSLLN